MELHVIAPPPQLAPLIQHTLAVRLECDQFHVAATVLPSLIVHVRGAVSVAGRTPDEPPVQCPRFYLRGPSLVPNHVFCETGTVSLGVTFRPGMFRQALGIGFDALTDNVLPMQALADPVRLETLFAELESAPDLPAMAGLLHAFLLERLEHRSKPQIGAAFLAARVRLYRPLLELVEYFGLGKRQLERRILEQFGLSLRDVRRVTRFGLALPHIVGQPVAWGDLTRIAHEAGYYDQAHMHREFVEMAGLAPVQLLQKIAGDDPAYWLFRLSEAQFRDLYLSLPYNS